MIYSNHKITEAQRDQGITGGGDQFRLDDHRFRSQHIDVALIELAKAAARRTICAPDRLNLIALKKLWQLVLILSDDASEWDRQVITQRQIGLASLFMLTALENFEDELVALFPILAHQ